VGSVKPRAIQDDDEGSSRKITKKGTKYGARTSKIHRPKMVEKHGNLLIKGMGVMKIPCLGWFMVWAQKWIILGPS